ncbi:hypothetical protein Tco_1318485 [Tanacetum coccineum]
MESQIVATNVWLISACNGAESKVRFTQSRWQSVSERNWRGGILDLAYDSGVFGLIGVRVCGCTVVVGGYRDVFCCCWRRCRCSSAHVSLSMSSGTRVPMSDASEQCVKVSVRDRSVEEFDGTEYSDLYET